jgi:hypothetical protein
MASKKSWVKISGGGPWDGSLWLPQGPTPEAAARAEEYKNEIVEDEAIEGFLHKGIAFGDKDVFYVANDKGHKTLLPEHGGLYRDCGIAIEEKGDGVEVRIEYKGQVKIKNGRHAGKNAHAYDVMTAG